MTTAQPAIKTILQQAIIDAQNKSADAASGSTMQQTTADLAKQKQEAIRVKESVLDSKQLDLDNIRESLQDPPKKEVNSGKHKTKTVVDDQEVAKLKKEEKMALQQVNLARGDVEQARTEAGSAANDALQAAGVSQELKNQMNSLLEKVNSIKDSLDSGNKVGDEKIKETVDEFNQISGSITKDMNKGKLISQAFFEPIKQGFQDIQKALTIQAATEATNNQIQSNSSTNSTSNVTSNNPASNNSNNSVDSRQNQPEAALAS